MKLKSGLWKLSPSSLYGYTECKSCFWVDNHFKKAPSIPPVLNMAMDSILKSRYDKYRKKKTFPPEVKQLKKEGVMPFLDLKQLNTWRNELSSLQVVNKEVGYSLRGKIDDVMVEKDGRMVIADYKSSGSPPSEDKQKYYRDQLAAYGFMFKKHGYKVSNRAYLLHYYVKDRNNPSDEVKFASQIDPVKIYPTKLERKLKEMVDLLNGSYPGHNPECEKCAYYEGRLKKTK